MYIQVIGIISYLDQSVESEELEEPPKIFFRSILAPLNVSTSISNPEIHLSVSAGKERLDLSVEVFVSWLPAKGHDNDEIIGYQVYFGYEELPPLKSVGIDNLRIEVSMILNPEVLLPH